jgi:hypothetical protein
VLLGGSSSNTSTVPGDTGAWVIDRRTGNLCGSILAWSSRKKVAYMIPMDVTLEDIKQTMNAKVIKLPDGSQEVCAASP